MARISIDFNNITSKIKLMQAMGQPPFAGGFLSFDFSYMNYLKEAGTTYSRLHDVGGAFGGNRFVDVPNLFRDFEADENDPSSYDFAFTDVLLEAMQSYDLAPIFRLGVTIENQAHIKAYRINPPKDPAKWARICEHIIRHYNEGWADGYHYNIKYWEIWNEPENGVKGKNQMWTGTAEQFFELYDVTAKHLKSCFGDTIKVGGYGASGFYGIYYDPEKYRVSVPKKEPDDRYEKDTYRVEFLYKFFDYIKEHNSPIDFFTWHSYANVGKTRILDEFLHNFLCERGYGDLERHLNEWNNAHERSLVGRSESSAATAAMLCSMQESHTDMLCYYDSRLGGGSYGGLFDTNYKPTCTYYVFYAYGKLYSLGGQAQTTVEDGDGLYVTAATDGSRKGVLIANNNDKAVTLETDLAGDFKAYMIGTENLFAETEIEPDKIELAPYDVIFLETE